MVKISIVVALYNEEENITPLIAKIDRAFQSGDIVYEAILVNDGSTDSTANEIMREVSEKVTFVDLKRNYGQTAPGNFLVHAPGRITVAQREFPYLIVGGLRDSRAPTVEHHRYQGLGNAQFSGDQLLGNPVILPMGHGWGLVSGIGGDQKFLAEIH